MNSQPKVRAITVDDLARLARLGLDRAAAMRAMAQDMAWMVDRKGRASGAATARLADSTVFLDSLVGDEVGQLALVDHAITYARWSDAPALTLFAPDDPRPLEDRGFVGLDPDRLPPSLLAAASSFDGRRKKVLMKRL